MALKSNSLSSNRILNNTKFWLLVIASGLTAIHLNLIYKYGDENLISIGIIFLFSVLYISWEQRDKIKVKNDMPSKLIGITIIAFIILKSAYISDFEPFVQFSPLLSAIGICLFTSGIKELKQYWRQLIMLLILAIPFEVAIPQIVDLASLTAKSSATILWCLGFGAHSQGIDVVLPTGSVEVSPHCTGLNVISRLLRLSILVLLMFPSDRLKSLFVPVVAVSIAFIGNTARIAVLAILVAYSKPKLFEFFHGAGGHLFTITSVLIFGLFYFFLFKQNNLKNLKTVEVEIE